MTDDEYIWFLRGADTLPVIRYNDKHEDCDDGYYVAFDDYKEAINFMTDALTYLRRVDGDVHDPTKRDVQVYDDIKEFLKGFPAGADDVS